MHLMSHGYPSDYDKKLQILVRALERYNYFLQTGFKRKWNLHTLIGQCVRFQIFTQNRVIAQLPAY